MGWGSDFIAALSNSAIVPIYELEFLSLNNSFPGGFTLNGHSGHARISDRSPRVYGTSVIPGRWNVTFGGFDVDIVGDLRPYSPMLSKGTFAVLRCSIRGSGGYTPFEVIGYGQLYSISGGRETFTLRFRDLLSAFQTSSSTKTEGSKHRTSVVYPEYRMFTNAGRSTTLTSPWNGTALSMVVDDVQIFERESAVNGVLKVEDLHNGKTFFLEWSNATVAVAPAGTLTLSSAVAKYPSPDSSAALLTGSNNTKITNCTRLLGTPWRIMAKILQSTGSNNPAGIGTNGAYDTYPITWSAGGGFSPDIFDYSDASTMSEYVRTQSGTIYSWQIILDNEQTDGFRALTDRSSKTGQWPVWRQGAVSWRACIDPTGIRCFQHPIVAMKINDMDIISISSHDWYSRDSGINYSQTKMVITQDWTSGSFSTTARSSAITSSRVQALPSSPIHQFDNSRTYKQSLPSVPSDMSFGDMDRLKGWDGYTHEKLVLQTKLKYATLCAGDIVEVDSDFIYGRDEAPGVTYNSKRAMITSVDFAISDQTCTLGLAVLPERYL